jgi:hypothetical protein
LSLVTFLAVITSQAQDVEGGLQVDHDIRFQESAIRPLAPAVRETLVYGQNGGTLADENATPEYEYRSQMT